MTLARTAIGAVLVAVLLVTVWAEPTDTALREIEIVRVTDGDTLTATALAGDSTPIPVTVRLYGVDAPETDQPGGIQATEFVVEWLEDRTVLLQEHDTDWYGRIIGEVFSDNPEDFRSLNEEIVYQGWAWWYREYAPHDDALAALESEARSAQRGLWAASTPTPPWDWR